MILRILEKGYLFSSINKELVFYRKHNLGNIGSGEKSKKGQIKYLEEMRLVIDKNLKNSKKALLCYNYELMNIYDCDVKYLWILIKLNPISLITLKSILKVIRRRIKWV